MSDERKYGVRRREVLAPYWRGVHALACLGTGLHDTRESTLKRVLRARCLISLLIVCVSVAVRQSRAAGATGGAVSEKPTVIVVVGAPGEPDYGADFAQAADAWAQACKRAAVNYIEIGRDPWIEESSPQTPVGQPATTAIAPATAPAPATNAARTDRQRLQDALHQQAQGTQPLWVVLLGHGTFAAQEAKFNLRGPDFSDAELAAWLKPLARPVALIDCSSASGSFLNKISAPGRVVITATQSGAEVNYARFGTYMAQAIADPGGRYRPRRANVPFGGVPGGLAPRGGLLPDQRSHGDGTLTP